jgi:hypothetical protein
MTALVPVDGTEVTDDGAGSGRGRLHSGEVRSDDRDEAPEAHLLWPGVAPRVERGTAVRQSHRGVGQRAGAFHTPIGSATLTAAISIGTYFTEHARAAFNLLGDTGTSDAAYLLHHLAKNNIKEFSIRSLHVELPRGRFATANDVTAAVATLADHGYVRAQPQPKRPGAGRPPSPAYLAHPELATISTESTESPDSDPTGRDR